jgi:hypothetical protein
MEEDEKPFAWINVNATEHRINYHIKKLKAGEIGTAYSAMTSGVI